MHLIQNIKPAYKLIVQGKGSFQIHSWDQLMVTPSFWYLTGMNYLHVRGLSSLYV